MLYVEVTDSLLLANRIWNMYIGSFTSAVLSQDQLSN